MMGNHSQKVPLCTLCFFLRWYVTKGRQPTNYIPIVVKQRGCATSDENALTISSDDRPLLHGRINWLPFFHSLAKHTVSLAQISALVVQELKNFCVVPANYLCLWPTSYLLGGGVKV